MGYYLQAPMLHDKAAYLLEKFGGVELMGPPEAFTDIPANTALVCVVDNGPFEAAGIAYSDRELAAFARLDGRPKTWLVLNNKQAVYDEAHVRPEDR